MSAARKAFLGDLQSLERAVDLPVLVDPSVDAGVRNRLIAGIAITAFISVEQFISARSTELAAFVSTGTTSFGDLREAVRKQVVGRAAGNLLGFVARHEETEWLPATQSIGGSFSGLGLGPVNIAPMTFAWSGSNLQTADVEALLDILGCPDKPWEHLTAILRRSGNLMPGTAAGTLFRTLATTRHNAAHGAQPPVTVTEIRALPRYALLTGFAVDCLASHLALEFQRGRLRELPQSSHSVVRLRFVERSGRKWRHIAEGKARGRRFGTRDEAWTAAVQVAGTSEETVVERAPAGEPLTWLSVFVP